MAHLVLWVAVGEQAVEQCQGVAFDPRGLADVDVIALHEHFDGLVTPVAGFLATGQVYEHAESQGTFSRAHEVDLKFVEKRAHDGQAAGQYIGAFQLDAGEVIGDYATRTNQFLLQAAQPFTGDAILRETTIGQDRIERLRGARRAKGFCPAELAVRFCDYLEFATRGEFGGFHGVGIDDAIRKELLAVAYAPHVER